MVMKRNALLFGMSLEQFWLGNPQDFYLYADLYQKEQERKVEELDYISWRIGLYTMFGTQQCLAIKNKSIFPKQPLLYKEHKDEKMSLKDKIMAGIERHNAYIRAQKALKKEN